MEGKPDTCPRCHHAIEPKEMPAAAALTGPREQEGTLLEVIYRCPRQKCARCFIGIYSKPHVHGLAVRDQFELVAVAPRAPREAEVAKEVADISPMFKKVYSQALAAEAYNLDQIAGVGLRKAIEFLVKDYCIHESPRDADAIRKEFLGETIKNRVTDGKVKAVAQRATWLGNDETHYERRWEGKDITDLKTLIELTLAWVRSDIVTKQYLQTMP